MENTLKTLLKVSRIANCHWSVLELRIPPIKQQKNFTNCGIFDSAYAIEFLHVENDENLLFDVTLMRDHLLVCLQSNVKCSDLAHFQSIP